MSPASITALRLISSINKKLNVNVSLSDLFVNQTIRQFSKCVSNRVSYIPGGIRKTFIGIPSSLWLAIIS